MDVTNEIHATLIVNALAEEGIRAVTTGASTAGFRAEVPGEIHIIVHESNVEQARAIVDSIDAGGWRLDEDVDDVGA